MTELDVSRVIASELYYLLNRLAALGGINLPQYEFLSTRLAAYDQAADHPITLTERQWIQPEHWPVIVKPIGFADQADGVVDTRLWALAELYPSRGFALEYLSQRHRQTGDRANYVLWQLELPPASPGAVAATLATCHPDERVTVEPGGEVITLRYRPPVQPEESG